MRGELRFRPPEPSDLADVHRIHSDPRTNLHNPAGPDDAEASATRLQEWLGHWERHGFGYEMVIDEDGSVAGVVGVRHGTWLGEPILNLYYRLAPEAWGRGIATAAGRHALDVAARAVPGVPVIAMTKPENLPSQRTAAAIGLVRKPDLEADDGTGPVVIYASAWASVHWTPAPGRQPDGRPTTHPRG